MPLPSKWLSRWLSGSGGWPSHLVGSTDRPWSPYLIGLPVPEEVDRAVQAPLDDGPAPRVVSLVTPHLHEAVGVLWLHQVDGAGIVAILQGLQAVSPRAWGHRGVHVTDLPVVWHGVLLLPAPPLRLHPPSRHNLQQGSSWEPQACGVRGPTLVL